MKPLIDTGADRVRYQIAQVYALRKNLGQMFARLEQAWSDCDPGLRRLHCDPFLARYRSDLRFVALANKIGLPAQTRRNPPLGETP